MRELVYLLYLPGPGVASATSMAALKTPPPPPLRALALHSAYWSQLDLELEGVSGERGQLTPPVKAEEAIKTNVCVKDLACPV